MQVNSIWWNALFLWNIMLFFLAWSGRTNWVYSFDAQRGVCRGCKFRKFCDPRGRGSWAGACTLKIIAYGENTLFLWNLLLFSREWSGQGGVQVWWSGRGLPGLWISLPLGQGFLARARPIGSYTKIVLFLKMFCTLGHDLDKLSAWFWRLRRGPPEL